MKIEIDVMKILDQCRVEGNSLYLPDIQLDRKLYVKTNKVLDLMGGKWNRSKKAHVFSIDNAEYLLNQCIETGEIVDVYKELQFFETPPKVVELMIEHAKLKPNRQVLEPSAGKGAIAKILLSLGMNLTVDTCEIHEPFRQILLDLGCRIFTDDFLNFGFAGGYSHILANPPFSNQQDIDHANHMLTQLAEGGTLVCVMSASVVWRTNRKTKLFHARLDSETDYEFIELPEGSFKESGTMVNTVLLVADKFTI